MDFEVLILVYFIVIMSAIFHEYAHAWMALYLGDPTAKNAGRLTLNPIAHIDTFGTIILPLLLMTFAGVFIGYAKPVPYNPHNLRDQKYGDAKVAVAGPASNLLIAFIFSLVIRFFELPSFWISAIGLIVFVNIILALFNLIPIAPLDGEKILKTFTPFDFSFEGSFLATILVLIIAFNFLPNIANFIFGLLVGYNF